ncbi:MAG: BTAD domain-containing putative transcriptional regulator, partial [Cyanobacteria bacterium P01_H01_bin.152]
MPSSKTSPCLQINLLGKYHLSVNGISIADIQSERLQALLAFLLLHRDAPQSRQQLAVQLWPEISEGEAKANLRRRLHELKQKLPAAQTWLQVEKKTVQWLPDADYTLDVAAFETAVKAAYPDLADLADPDKASGRVNVAALDQAAKLYQGDLLPECYDDWIVSYRDNFRNQAITVLDALIPRLMEQNQIRIALGYAQQLQRLDPLHEPAYCHLMRLHALAGDRASALRVYHQCMTLLQEELGVPPSPSTSSLYEALLTLEDNPQAVAQFATTLAIPTTLSKFDLEVPAWETADPKLPSPSLSEVEESPPNADLPPRPQKTAPPTSTVTFLLDTATAETVAATEEGSVAVPGKALSATRVDWGEAPDIRFFYGRSTEINVLKSWVTLDRSRLIVLLGMGGIGKTTLAAKVAQEVQSEFDCLIWRSLRNAPPLETLLTDLIPFLSHQQDTACSVARLMHWLRQSRCLVVLDNCETILKEGERAGQFRPGYENYGDLMQVIGQGNHQSCLVLTSREKPAEISAFEGIDLTV